MFLTFQGQLNLALADTNLQCFSMCGLGWKELTNGEKEMITYAVVWLILYRMFEKESSNCIF